MRLKQIKLAGFKSFVDPTTVPFPENLTAIVGPNGCGKSNLIDAVRWVMGESSAKHLRGDSMTDVIFNGSTSRKPVGQASIELVFDNSDGTLKGEFASYAEIALRRMVTRDGQSNYYLNGTKCRRKDITGIFLGTGLGPRSYAIIEQGMISRLIESKPQELRVFLEEAAGISKYKERRRETENRIKHTRENMERLTDIRDELGKQLAHLQRQANSATKYKAFKQDERRLKGELSALKWRKFNQQVESLSSEISKLETELEARIAEQRHADLEIEQTRAKHIDISDAFNQAQGNFYGIGADIARLEQSISHKKERQVQLNQDFQQVNASLSQATEQMSQDELSLTELREQKLELEPELELQQQKLEQAQSSLEELEVSVLDWEQSWEEYNKSSATNSQKMEVERTRIQHFDKVIERLCTRVDNNQKESDSLAAQPIEDDVLNASIELSKAEEETNILSENVEVLFDEISEMRNQRRSKQKELEASRSKLQKIQSEHISLNAIQRAALGDTDTGVADWLSNNALAENKKLAQSIKVDSGWEDAVEMVLGDYLEATSCDSFSVFESELSNLETGRLCLVNNSGAKQDSSLETGLETRLETRLENGLELLSSKIHHLNVKVPTLNHVFVSESLSDALAKRESLTAEQSLITKDGFWIANNWIRVAKKESEEMSLLERESKLETLTIELEKSEAELELLQTSVDDESERLKDSENTWEEKQRELRVVTKTYSDLRAQVGSQQAKLEQMVKRKDALVKEKGDLTHQLQVDETALSQSRLSLEKLVDAMADDLEQKESLSRQKEEKRRKLDDARNQARQSKDKSHELELSVANINAEINSSQSTNQRMQQQVAEMQSRRIQLQDSLENANSPDDELQLELDSALEKRLQSENALGQAKDNLEVVEKSVRVFEKQRGEAEQSAQSVRSRLEKLRMQWSENSAKQNSQEENISSHDDDIQSILNHLEEGANEEEWNQRLESVASKIQRLGAINLAAIDEHTEQSERKIYLDAQHEDLDEALESLESAIRKIDKETRTRFKETFDKVNAGLKELFPKIFGGGHAYLELTGEDLLDTGVTVMARPPGKRNSTIHLLSGGEKALTALSLVFSIFRLNPAPFCMLDEVDAPLDDANVGRFCKLVKEMSEHLQFIYITHNKVSMEMANALVGVTMQEPGASRLVAVNVDEAADLAGI